MPYEVGRLVNSSFDFALNIVTTQFLPQLLERWVLRLHNVVMTNENLLRQHEPG